MKIWIIAAVMAATAGAATAQTTAPAQAVGRWAYNCAEGASVEITPRNMILRNGADRAELPLRGPCPMCSSTPGQPWVTGAVGRDNYVAMQVQGNAATVDRWNAGPMSSRFPVASTVNRCPR